MRADPRATSPTQWAAPHGQELRGSPPALPSYSCFAAERHAPKMRLGVRFGVSSPHRAPDRPAPLRLCPGAMCAGACAHGARQRTPGRTAGGRGRAGRRPAAPCRAPAAGGSAGRDRVRARASRRYGHKNSGNSRSAENPGQNVGVTKYPERMRFFWKKKDLVCAHSRTEMIAGQTCCWAPVAV